MSQAVIVSDMHQVEWSTRQVASAIVTATANQESVSVDTLRSVMIISVALYVIAEAVVAASFRTLRCL